MDLLIDIGNTNLKWAQCQAGVVGEMQTVRHHGGLPIDVHAAWEYLDTPRRVLVGSVGGEAVANALKRTCRSRWRIDPRFARTELFAYGVTVAYDRPDRLGVDRWLAMLAAHSCCAGPVLVVDAGTAVTFDMLRSDGHHIGGLILPGVDMMRSILLSGTKIPNKELEETAGPWAVDTATAIAAGSIQAPAALVERLHDRLAAEVGGDPSIILTGGDAERLLPAIGRPAAHRPDLVLQGLALLV